MNKQKLKAYRDVMQKEYDATGKDPESYVTTQGMLLLLDALLEPDPATEVYPLAINVNRCSRCGQTGHTHIECTILNVGES